MTNRVAVLALGIFAAGCSNSLGPDSALEASGPAAPAFAVAGGASWVKLQPITTGVAAWIHTRDATSVVIGLGADRAREATYTGTNSVRIFQRLMLFRTIASYFGAPKYMGLEKNKKWLKKVRNGQNVGLWIRMRLTPNRYSPTGFQVVDVQQRPIGSDNPPTGWL